MEIEVITELLKCKEMPCPISQLGHEDRYCKHNDVIRCDDCIARLVEEYNFNEGLHPLSVKRVKFVKN